MTVYLRSFTLASQAQEEDFWDFSNPKARRTCYTTYYPFGVFRRREPGTFTFAPITIFCGGNGSGKSTLLNIIAEALQVQRGTVYNRTDFFDDYTALCAWESGAIPDGSRILTSDDVFDHLIGIRELNEGIHQKRAALFEEYTQARHAAVQLRSLADYEEFAKTVDAQRKSASQYVKGRLMENMPEQSNGESALDFFTGAVEEGALYLLDEPENSLSAARQLELRQFLEDSARFYRCQLILATHSPFLLSLPRAKIYDLDESPAAVKQWTALETVRAYYEFFRAHAGEFSP